VTLQVLVTNLLGCLSAVSKIDEENILFDIFIVADCSSVIKSFGTVD